jgi:hypothetical protein
LCPTKSYRPVPIYLDPGLTFWVIILFLTKP